MADEPTIEYPVKELVDRLEAHMNAGFVRIETKLDSLSIRMGRMEEWQATERYAQKNHVAEHKKIDTHLAGTGRRLTEVERKVADESVVSAALTAARAKTADWRRWAVGVAAMVLGGVIAEVFSKLVH